MKSKPPLTLHHIKDTLYRFDVIYKDKRNINEKINKRIRKLIDKSINNFEIDDMWDYNTEEYKNEFFDGLSIKTKIKIGSVEEL